MDVFDAVADPTRRAIVDMLGRGPLDAGTIGTAFQMSQPGVSRHLRLLRETGIVEVEVAGRRRFYRLRPEGMAPVEDWVERYRSFWPARLDELATRAEEAE